MTYVYVCLYRRFRLFVFWGYFSGKVMLYVYAYQVATTSLCAIRDAVLREYRPSGFRFSSAMVSTSHTVQWLVGPLNQMSQKLTQ